MDQTHASPLAESAGQAEAVDYPVIKGEDVALAKFVWNDDCPAWPVRLVIGEAKGVADGQSTSTIEGYRAWHARGWRYDQTPTQAWVSAPVLLAMVKAVATNTTNGIQFVDDEDAVESVARIAKAQPAWFGYAGSGHLVYDVSDFVFAGSMEPDIIEAAGYEAIGEDGILPLDIERPEEGVPVSVEITERGQKIIDAQLAEREHAVYVVWWTDYVANDWVELVEGDPDTTEERLALHALKGRDVFGMKFVRVSGSIGSEEIGITGTPTPIDAFLDPGRGWD